MLFPLQRSGLLHSLLKTDVLFFCKFCVCGEVATSNNVIFWSLSLSSAVASPILHCSVEILGLYL